MTLVELANAMTLQGDIRISLWEGDEETKVKTYTETDDLSFMNIPEWAEEKEVNYIFCGGDGYLHIELKAEDGATYNHCGSCGFILKPAPIDESLKKFLTGKPKSDKMGLPNQEEVKAMPDSEAKKAWMRANTVIAAVKLNRNTDKDIIDFFGDKISASVIKAALREYIKNHPEE